MAYTFPINPNSKDSHQTSPAYMLTFLRWASRDTHNFSDAEFLELRKPLLVVNDCISLNVSSSKSNHIHTVNMVLLAGDINYSTAVAPGDFVMVNMLDNDEKLFGKSGTPTSPNIDSLYSRAENLKPINHAHDGFKGCFKIQSVTRNIKVNPSSGHKIYAFQISAAAFTEFNQVMYFDPNQRDSGENAGNLTAINFGASEEWNEAVLRKTNAVDDIFKVLVELLLGKGFDKIYPQKPALTRNFNQNFLIPPTVCSLMNVKAGLKPKAADLFTFYVGIQKFSKSATESQGLNPSNAVRSGHFIDSGLGRLSGAVLLQGEPFGQVTVWSIFQQYSNSLINEMYTAYKLTPEGDIKPCVVYRQKPFTSANFKTAFDGGGIPVTEFLSLPRWNVSTKLIESISLGRHDQARVNFVHIVGKVREVDMKAAMALQHSLHQHQYDTDDIKRNGLRPIITSCDFAFPRDGVTKNEDSIIWNKLYADWVFNGHLKENGTITCAGIYEPIAVGDNLQLENTVFHIESISHVMGIDSNGSKQFKTNISLSFGVDDIKASGYNPIYPEMEHTDSYKNRLSKYGRKTQSSVLPGFSDSQDIAGRVSGEEVDETNEKAFSIIPKFINSKNDEDE